MAPPTHNHKVPENVALKALTPKRTRVEVSSSASGSSWPLLKLPPLRGHTARGRLRLVDSYLNSKRALGRCKVVVDVGFGDAPWTALELADNLPAGAILYATDIVEDRVARADAYDAHPDVDVRFVVADASFALPAESGAPELVRCCNVLRDLHAFDAAAALCAMHVQLAGADAVLVEASTDATGTLAFALVLRGNASAGGNASVSEVVFAVDECATADGAPPSWFEAHLFPRAFAAYAPAERELGGRDILLKMLEAWRAVCLESELSDEPVVRFDQSATRLAGTPGCVPGVVETVGRGVLVWRPGDGVLQVPTYHPRKL